MECHRPKNQDRTFVVHTGEAVLVAPSCPPQGQLKNNSSLVLITLSKGKMDFVDPVAWDCPGYTMRLNTALLYVVQLLLFPQCLSLPCSETQRVGLDRFSLAEAHSLLPDRFSSGTVNEAGRPCPDQICYHVEANYFYFVSMHRIVFALLEAMHVPAFHTPLSYLSLSMQTQDTAFFPPSSQPSPPLAPV